MDTSKTPASPDAANVEAIRRAFRQADRVLLYKLYMRERSTSIRLLDQQSKAKSQVNQWRDRYALTTGKVSASC